LVRYQRIIAEGADLRFRPTAKGYELTLAIHGDRRPGPASAVPPVAPGRTQARGGGAGAAWSH